MDRLTALHAFTRLVELGSFTATAEELQVKQSTVSKWLAALEKQLGVQLLERTTRSQRLTEPGELLYERARQILASYEDTCALLQEQAPELRGRLRISVPVVFGRRFLLPLVGSFLREHPAISMELVLDDRYVNLVQEDFDLAIRVGATADSSLRARTLGSSGRCLVASPTYLETAGEPQHPSDLDRHSCVVHTGLDTADVWVFERADERHRALVRGRFSSNNSEALLEMAKSGVGIALLASWLVEEEVRSGQLVSLLDAWQLPEAPVQGIMPPGRYLHPRVRALLDFLQDRFAEVRTLAG
jgi:DNA-binding transcriptional LysR family regulator